MIRRLLPLALLAAAALPLAARAQIHAPSIEDGEGDDQAQEPQDGQKPAPPPEDDTATEPAIEPPAPHKAPPPAEHAEPGQAAQPAKPQQKLTPEEEAKRANAEAEKANEKKAEQDKAETEAKKELKAGGSVAPAEELAKLARPIEPVKAGAAQILAAWQARREALRDQDPPKAREEEKQILAAREELAIEDLPDFSAALTREAERALLARAPGDAVARAQLAVKLAPDLPAARLMLARARFAAAPASVGGWLSPLGSAVGASWREPHTRRAVIADLLASLLAAVGAAAVIALLALIARKLRYALHDFHHLFPRGAARAQTVFFALVILALPLVLRAGAVAFLGVALVYAWLYLSRSERIVATVAFAALVGLPYGVGAAARLTTWTGSLAEQVYELEKGGALFGEGEALAERAKTESLPAPALMALGRWAKRKGDLDAAAKFYEDAARADPGSPEVQVDLGNVRLIQGDLDGAKAAYLAATDRASAQARVSTLAAAHYDLSKLFFRQTAIDRGQEARRKAVQEDPGLIERLGVEDDFRQNRYLIDAPVPAGQIEALAAVDPRPAEVQEQVRARLAGAIPASSWPWLPLGLVAALWLLLAAERALAPSHACDKCGRPVCKRCDGVQGGLCGQCVNVYVKKGVVEPRDRLRKEAQVRRYAQRQEWVARALAIVGGGLGHLFAGRAFQGFALLVGVLFVGFLAWFARGVAPPPQPSDFAPAVKLVIAVPLGLGLYALGVWSAFKATRD